MLRSRTTLVLVTGILIGLSLSAGVNVIAARHTDAQSAQALPWEDARLLAEVLQRIQSDYVEPVSEHKLMEDAVRGMVSGLDAHSAFLDKDEYEEMQAETAGSYTGIGVEVAATERGVEVMRAMAGTPADAAGVRAGDLIVAVDGIAVDTAAPDEAIARLRGRAGTSVRISLHRDGAASPLDFSLKRTQVEVHSVAGVVLEPGFGYLRIQQFTETTQAEVLHSLRELVRQSPQGLAGLVIDLRNNPGGLLDAAVEIADDFLDGGNIVSADGRGSDARFRMDATPGDVLGGAPIMVLVNGNSASAAEILAGALHDNHRALLIGRRTYGKGSVQSIMPLSLGRAIKLTTSHYFTPSGASINQVGIQPDLPYDGVELPPSEPDGSATAAASSDPEVRLALDSLKKAPPRLARLQIPKH